MTASVDIIRKPSTQLNLVDAVPCKIAFEKDKEGHFCFLAISVGSSGCVVLAEELPLKPHYGVVRVVAPLAGRNDERLMNSFTHQSVNAIEGEQAQNQAQTQNALQELEIVVSKTRSSISDHFIRFKEDGMIKRKCKYCSQVLKADSDKNGTSGLKSH